MASRSKQPQSFTMPDDWDKMPIGFYLRMGKDGRWQIGGQKSELSWASRYEVLGPIPLPKRAMDGFPTLDFKGLEAALDGAIRELKEMV